jgi:hypothetical protein
MDMLRTVVDVIFALTTLLGGQRLSELALGLVIGSLILLGRLILIGRPVLIGFHKRAPLCSCARPRGFKGSSPLLISRALMGLILPLITRGANRLLPGLV